MACSPVHVVSADAFNKWEAGQRLAKKLLVKLYEAATSSTKARLQYHVCHHVCNYACSLVFYRCTHLTISRGRFVSTFAEIIRFNHVATYAVCWAIAHGVF